MPLYISIPTENGIIPVAVSPIIHKSRRLDVGATGLEVGPEVNPGFEDWGGGKISDFANVVIWRHDHSRSLRPRGGYGSWSSAFPAIVDDGAWLPIARTDYSVDDDFARRDDFAHQGYLSRKIPSGIVAAVLETTAHTEHGSVPIISGGPLIAQQRGNSPHQYSSFVNEIADDSIDASRKGLLSDTHWVRGWIDSHLESEILSGTRFDADQSIGGGHSVVRPIQPSVERREHYAALLNGTRSTGRLAGYGTFTFEDKEASISGEVSGPIVPATVKHKIWETYDGRDWNSASISTEAYINAGDPEHDCPAEHEMPFHPQTAEGVIPYHVHKMVDPKMRHRFLRGERAGLWRRHTRLPIGEKPPCDASRATRNDGNGNPRETYPASPSTFVASMLQSGGLTFKAQHGILRGGIGPNYWGYVSS